jgi:hypothetical protein
MVVLHGLGGVGKTQLAVEYAWRHLGGYEAVLWVRADSPEALDANLAGLAQVLDLLEAGEPRQNVKTDAVLNWLKRHQRWLLVADNADTDEAAKAVLNRFPPHLRGHVLVTSRLGYWPVAIAQLSLELLSPNDGAHYLQNRVGKEGHHADDDTAARKLAEELGNLPLALEQAGAFLIELRWSFDQYREQLRAARPELLGYQAEGGTLYPASVAKTWSITLERLSPLARTLLRLAAWLAPDDIPRSIFRADRYILFEALFGKNVTISDLTVEKALSELGRFSLIRLTFETVSVHRLLQAVEQDTLTKEERARWVGWAARLCGAFAPPPTIDDFQIWRIWLSIGAHVETVLEHAKHQGVERTALSSLLVLRTYLSDFFRLMQRAMQRRQETLEQAAAKWDKLISEVNPEG